MKPKRFIQGKTVLYIITQIFLQLQLTSCDQEFEEQPSDITVTRGSPVSFPCKVKNLKGTLQWTMDGFGLGTDRELKAFPRFMMIGSNETGNYTLHITAALLADEAEYQCQVGGTETEKPLRSTKAKLTVLYPPKDDSDHVYISPESPLQTVSGSTVRITCTGGLTKPVSKITWKKGNDTIDKGITESIESLPKSSLESITSWVDIKSDETYHKQTISCVVSHEAIQEPIVRSLTMYVQYPPSVTIAKHFLKAKEGDEIKFTCTATGNPPNLRFRWEVNDVAVVGDHESEFVFKDITRKDNNAKVACIVSNAVGNGRAEETVNISRTMEVFLRGPPIIVPDQVSYGLEDKDMEKQTSTSTEDSVLKTDTRTITGSDLSPSEDDIDLSNDEDWDETTNGSRGIHNRLQRNTYRFSGDFSNPVFPPKTPNNNGTGYIPYVDYSTDYNPPTPTPNPLNYNRNSLYSPIPLNNVDPRYSAAYGNPYLRVPQNSRSIHNIYGSDNRLPTQSQTNIINLASHPVAKGTAFQNNNLNVSNPNNKNVLYENRNNLANNKINSQYVVIPHLEGKEIQGTHI
ncbi:Irregular chiasm C-roughest protein [Armadillidium nasatum]|uniref:Irregular chiasm C-roughest protein n=2 Tax=Armadillidium nasatum TaxID=96803 RepID=A0A5N5SX47_9CRUS|nr:Irregular chiasm C-roughest protein [Armadillidium nasatum]